MAGLGWALIRKWRGQLAELQATGSCSSRSPHHSFSIKKTIDLNEEKKDEMKSLSDLALSIFLMLKNIFKTVIEQGRWVPDHLFIKKKAFSTCTTDCQCVKKRPKDDAKPMNSAASWLERLIR